MFWVFHNFGSKCCVVCNVHCMGANKSYDIFDVCLLLLKISHKILSMSLTMLFCTILWFTSFSNFMANFLNFNMWNHCDALYGTKICSLTTSLNIDEFCKKKKKLVGLSLKYWHFPNHIDNGITVKISIEMNIICTACVVHVAIQYWSKWCTK